MFLFPRKNYKEYFIREGPPDCIGTSNPSGWTTEDKFVIFIKHFIKHVKPTKESPVLLLLDNHSSHLAIHVLNLAKDNGIIMLSFPPHCSHRLQPLDVGVYGPFKKYLSSAQDAWMRSNPGKTITIYDIPLIVSNAFPLAMSPTNIINGFKKSGIFPFNRQIFTDIDFAPSYVTDRPNPQAAVQKTVIQPIENIHPPMPDTNEDPTTNETTDQPYVVNTNNVLDQEPEYLVPGPSNRSEINMSFSPHMVKPLPKAGPRTQAVKGRKRRHTAILTDIPEKEALAQEQALQHHKKKKELKKNKKK